MTTPQAALTARATEGGDYSPEWSCLVRSIEPITWHIQYSLDEPDWAALRELWASDPMASPFASPAFLETRARHALANGGTPVFARGLSGRRTVALWPLVVDSGERLRFLQQAPHADQSTCLASPGIDASSLGEGLAHALRLVRPRDLVFHRVPPWGRTLDAIRAGIAQSGWRSYAFPVLPCPVVGTQPGPGAAAAFHAEFHRHSRLRTKENRLKRMPGFGFEVLEDGCGLEEWATEFCDVHEWRWNRTDTPSQYRVQSARTVFLEHLHAWSRDGVLRRFAIRLHDQRLAFAACLVGGDRLLYHHLAACPGYGTLSLGKVLLRMVGIWGSQNDLLTLDLGIGDETYKYEFASHTDMLWRVCAAPGGGSLLLSRGAIEHRIRRTPAALGVWNRLIKGGVRDALLTAASRSQRVVHRMRSARTGTWAPLVPAVHASGRTAVLITYRGRGTGFAHDPDVVRLSTSDLLDLMQARTPDERATAIERRYGGATAVALRRNGDPIMTMWLVGAGPIDHAAPAPESCWRIEPFLFRRGSRTPGALSQLLGGCLRIVPAGALVEVRLPRSRRLERELRMAGFEPVASGSSEERFRRREHQESGAPIW